MAMPDGHDVSEPGSTPIISRRFGALAYKEFRLLWAGLLVSNTGSWMATLAQGWLVVELSPNQTLAPFYLGLVGFVRAIPVFLLSGVAGTLADRVDRRRLLIISQSALGISALALAILSQLHVVKIWHVLVLAAVSAAGLSFDAPTRQSLVPHLVPKGQLMNAIGLNSAAFNGPAIIGPALGGILVSTVGVADCFYINALSYGAVLLALGAISPKPPLLDVERRGIWHEMLDGLRYVRSQPAILAIFALAVLMSIVARPYIQLMPAFAKGVIHRGADGLGILMAVSGAGALGGSIATAFIGAQHRRGILMLSSGIASGAALFCFALTRNVLSASCALVVLGAAIMLFMGMTNTLLQTHTPLVMRGRVMSLYTMIFLGFMPLGAWLLGSAATLTSLPSTLAIAGALVLVASAAMTRFIALRDLA
ncbi:MAG: MFS transporter [Candidatus Eremiobacteraeota bacterium]|nr:MFS transporter [Candidatus Eremiobacteraeota bacterium]MBC5807873.1 MFS transporter [Candidatus Eremiobacteraeota bacterium]